MLRCLVDYLYPPQCVFCDGALQGPASSPPSLDAARSFLCERCNRLDAFRTASAIGGYRICSSCGERLLPGEEDSACFLCRMFPAEPAELRSLFFYSEDVEQLLKHYKYGHARALGRPLGKLLASFAASEPFSPHFYAHFPDVVIPVPSSRESLLRRGFNHLAPIAAEIGRQIRRPVLLFALRSQGRRKPQALLSPASAGARLRARNIEGGFRAERARVEGKSILLVDDIVTTGASLRECARALRAAGAAHVFGLTLARSSHFSRHRVGSVLPSLLHSSRPYPGSGR